MPDVVVVSGTGTEIGKTWTCVHLIGLLRDRGAPVSARKPVQSFEENGEPTDADLLAAATGESPYDVCPPDRWYPMAVAPPMAAQALDREPIALGDLVAELRLPSEGVVLVEGVGGPRSPLADDGDTVELARELAAGLVLLVSDGELGSVNAVTLAAEALRERPLMVFVNRYDDARPLHRWNVGWFREVAGLEVATSLEEVADRIIGTARQASGGLQK